MKYLIFLFLCFTLVVHSQTTEFFSPNSFVDKDRVEKIKSTFSLIEKMYSDHAVKNHFPGYSFGIVVDGQLIFKGSGGFSNMKIKLLPLLPHYSELPLCPKVSLLRLY